MNENTRFVIYTVRDFYSERKYKILTVDKNTRFLIYIYERFL